jgi:hypothetical protein
MKEGSLILTFANSKVLEKHGKVKLVNFTKENRKSLADNRLVKTTENIVNFDPMV